MPRDDPSWRFRKRKERAEACPELVPRPRHVTRDSGLQQSVWTHQPPIDALLRDSLSTIMPHTKNDAVIFLPLSLKRRGKRRTETYMSAMRKFLQARKLLHHPVVLPTRYLRRHLPFSVARGDVVAAHHAPTKHTTPRTSSRFCLGSGSKVRQEQDNLA